MIGAEETFTNIHAVFGKRTEKLPRFHQFSKLRVSKRQSTVPPSAFGKITEYRQLSGGQEFKINSTFIYFYLFMCQSKNQGVGLSIGGRSILTSRENCLGVRNVVSLSRSLPHPFLLLKSGVSPGQREQWYASNLSKNLISQGTLETVLTLRQPTAQSQPPAERPGLQIHLKATWQSKLCILFYLSFFMNMMEHT